MNPITVSEVRHPETNELLAFEIVANDGRTYFVSNDRFCKGMLCEGYPRIFVEGRGYVRPERVEIARMG